uniref:Uncharacterized protein n=1 Tax=Oryza nivara TaxID=4536 RepID=A0A0E0HXS5_ORYNI
MSHHNFASFQEQEVELLTYVGYKLHEHPCKDHFQWVTSPSAQLEDIRFGATRITQHF